MTDLTDYTRDDIRGLAILKVDAAHGYSIEQSGSPERHRMEYAEKEAELLAQVAEQWRERERQASRRASETGIAYGAAMHQQSMARQRVKAIERWQRELQDA